MSGMMFRTLVVIALCGASMGILVDADQSELDINEKDRGFLLKKNILIHPIIMNGSVFQNETSMNKNSNPTSKTETQNHIDPLGDVLALLKTSAINDSNVMKKEQETTFSNKDISSPSSAVPEKATPESEWIPIPAVKSNIPLNNVPIASTESEWIPTETLELSSPSELDVEMSTEYELNATETSGNKNSQDTTSNDIVQKSTAISLELSTSTIRSTTPNASITALATHSTFQTEGTETNSQETVVSDSVSSETASVSDVITEVSTLSETATSAAISSKTESVSEANTETSTLSEKTTNDAVSSETASVSETITEISTLSPFDNTVSASSFASSEITQSSQRTTELPMSSPSGREDSTSSPGKTEISTQSSTSVQTTTGIYSSSDATKDTTTEKEKSTPTLETKDKTDVETSSPLTTPITDGITSSPIESTTVHIKTIKKRSLTTLKLALAFTFLVISLIAMAVLLAYMVKIRKRTIPYEELSLEP